MNIKDHIPEILTGVAVGGEIAADILFVRAAKKEAKDGKKKHYILPSIVSGVSIASIIASNRISNEQKLSLLAASALSTTQLTQYKKAVKETVDEKTYADISKKFTDDQLNSMKSKVKSMDDGNGDSGDPQLYYWPQLDILCYSYPLWVTCAALNMNQVFCNEGWVPINFYFKWINKDLLKKDPYLKKYGNDIGFAVYDDDPFAGYTYISMQEYRKQIPGIGPVTYIYFIEEPLRADEWEEYYENNFLNEDPDEEKVWKTI